MVLTYGPLIKWDWLGWKLCSWIWDGTGINFLKEFLKNVRESPESSPLHHSLFIYIKTSRNKNNFEPTSLFISSRCFFLRYIIRACFFSLKDLEMKTKVFFCLTKNCMAKMCRKTGFNFFVSLLRCHINLDFMTLKHLFLTANGGKDWWYFTRELTLRRSWKINCGADLLFFSCFCLC